mmetsp:Transcript_9137/g.20928  ORF Transcript_9137/g.20928 Transcript_9137/m.20928 type:complete len:184 (-) Transcript_9137:246-797(-)
MDPNDMTLTIRTSYSGVWGACQVDADCMHVPCANKCMPCTLWDCQSPSVCTPNTPDMQGCTNETKVSMSPDGFKAACPPDHRDGMCKDIEAEFLMSGCDTLFESDVRMLPDAEAKATECLGYLERHMECSMQFAQDPLYQQHRAAPEWAFARLRNIIDGKAGTYCGSIPANVAVAINAVRCDM